MAQAIKSSMKIEDPILKILSTGQLLSFSAIQQQIQLSKRQIQRRLNQLVKEGIIRKYHDLTDTRRFCYMIAE